MPGCSSSSVAIETEDPISREYSPYLHALIAESTVSFARDGIGLACSNDTNFSATQSCAAGVCSPGDFCLVMREILRLVTIDTLVALKLFSVKETRQRRRSL